MPDEWGRVTGNDFMQLANTMGNIQAMGQRNTMFRQHQADRAKKQQLEDDANYNAGLYQPGAIQLDEGSRTAAMRGTPQAMAMGKQIALAGMEADKAIQGYAQDKDYQQKLSGLLAWRQQNPDMDWERVPLDLYGGIQGHRAYADIIDREAKTEQGKNTIMKNRMARMAVAYKQFDSTKRFINEAMKQGDTSKAVAGVKSLVKNLPFPYQVGSYDPESQTFEVEYLDSKTGKFQKSGTRTFDEMIQEINATGEKEFVEQMTIAFEATRQGNLEKRQNPLYAKSTNGTRFLVIPQKNVLDPAKVDIEVRNERTNEKVVFPSWEAMQDVGIRIENLEREKALKGLAIDDQKLKEARSKVHTAGLKYSKDSVDLHNKKTKMYRDDLAFVLTPFVKPGTDMSSLFDEDENMTQAAENALQSAMSFVKNNPDSSKLDEFDRMKLEKGKQAIRLYDMMSQSVSGNYDQGHIERKSSPNSPPVKGAKKAKDGEWYVQKGGKWAKVVKDKVETGPLKSSHEPSGASGGRSNLDQTNAYPQGNNVQPNNQAMVGSSGDIVNQTKKAISITGGEYDQRLGGIVFMPQNQAQLDNILMALDSEGVQFDAKMLQDGGLLIVVNDKQQSAMQG